MDVSVNKKTGFEIIDPYKEVVIRDEKGKLFYSTAPYLPRIKYFNLPAGFKLFKESGRIRPMGRPVRQKLYRLPKRERLLHPSPRNFRIEFGHNPNKCSVYWYEGKILFDNEIAECSIPQVFFMLYHEFGHEYYTTEKYADLFARNMMLKRGFNKSQIGEAILKTLSAKNYDRKEKIIKSLL